MSDVFTVIVGMGLVFTLVGILVGVCILRWLIRVNAVIKRLDRIIQLMERK